PKSNHSRTFPIVPTATAFVISFGWTISLSAARLDSICAFDIVPTKITRHRIDELKLAEDFEVIRIANAPYSARYQRWFVACATMAGRGKPWRERLWLNNKIRVR